METHPHDGVRRRSDTERLDDLELVVYGNERQRVKGLIDSLSDLRTTVTNQLTTISDDVRILKDNRRFLLQVVVQLATLATSALALYWSLKHP